MRHLKKVTALALVFVMVFALMLSNASAYTYKDQKDIDSKYQAAVDMMYELQIMQGSTSDNFFPANGLKRSELSKMLYVVANRGSTNASPYLTVTGIPFKDYTTSDWFAGYVNWAYIQKIVQGTSETKFSPNNDVKGYEALKMALGIAGYRSDIEGYTGANWQMNVLRDAMDAGLLEGLLGLDLSKAISREEAAQMLYNLLYADIQAYSTGMTVDRYPVLGQTVGSKYFGLQTLEGVLWATPIVALGGAAAADGELIVTESNYTGGTKNIEGTAPIDWLGRKVKVFVKGTADGDKITKIDKVYGNVVLAGGDNVITTTVSELKPDGLGLKYDGKYTIAAPGADPSPLWVNYDPQTIVWLGANVQGDNPVTLIYDTGKTAVKYALVKNYEFCKIEVLANKKVTANYFNENGSTAFSAISTDDIFEGAALAVKDALVLVAKIGGKYQLLEIDTLKDAKVTSVSGAAVYIGGKKYEQSGILGTPVSFAFAKEAIGDTKDFYVFNGKLLGASTAEEADAVYAVITGIEAASLDGRRVRVMTSDQGEKTFYLSKLKDSADAEKNVGDAGYTVADLEEMIFTYTMDGAKIVLKEVATVNAGMSIANDKVGNATVQVNANDEYVGTGAVIFVKKGSDYYVYKGRTIPVMTAAQGTLFGAKHGDPAADGKPVINVAFLETTGGVNTGVANKNVVLVANDVTFGKEGDDGFLYFEDLFADKIYKWGASDSTDTNAKAGSVLIIDSVDSGNALKIDQATLYKAGFGAGFDNATVKFGYVSDFDSNVLWLAKCTVAAAAFDAGATIGYTIDGDTKYYVYDGDAVTAGVRTDLIKTNALNAELNKFSTTIVLDSMKVTHVFINATADFWG